MDRWWIEDRGCMTLIVAIIVASFVTILTVALVYPVYADVDAMKNRAQVSADAGKMADRLDQTLANMERHGVTQGYAALIFKSPENDVALDYEALVDLRERARDISELDKASVEYQTALDDMRGTIREIYIDAGYYAAIRHPLTWISLLLWGLVASFVFFKM